MTEAAAGTVEEPKPKGKKGVLLLAAAALLLGGGGFASTYLGFWSPGALLAPGQEKALEASPAVFVDVPTIALHMPGSPPRELILSASIETDQAHQAEVQHLMPRVSDAFTSFLSEVDRAAYDKRGVLEIIRAELVTRTRYVLGEEPVKDLLITEFRIR